MTVRGKFRSLLLGVVLMVAGVATPPASATTTAVIALAGTVQLNGPLDWACPVTTTKCTATVPGLNVTGGPKGVPVVDVVPVAGNVRGLTVNSGLCVSTNANVMKTKPPLTVGPCFVSGAGAITGFCNLATGVMTAFVTDSLGQTFRLAIKFTWLGPSGPPASSGTAIPTAMTMTGTATKLSTGATGWVLGEGVAAALPQLVPGNSCFTKTATTFTLAASLEVVIKN